MRRGRPSGLLLAATLATATPAMPEAPGTSAPLAAPASDREPFGRDLTYRIGPEDVLRIDVWRNEALSLNVPVRPDGMISLPLLNDVQAEGLTPLELRTRLREGFTAYIDAPEVVVIVAEVHSFKVSVLGEVAKPGRYELGSRATVLDVLALAGGLSEFAKRSNIVVLREDASGSRSLPFDYDKAAFGRGGQVNFALRSGDIVVVP